MLLILGFIFSTVAFEQSQFLEGFLSGFQGEEVALGPNCLQEEWLNQMKSDIFTFSLSLSERDYPRTLSSFSSIIQALIEESNDCHFPDLLNILEFLQSLPLKKKISRIISNFPEFFQELKQANPTNMYTFGYHLGKALSLLEKTPSKPQEITGAALADVLEGILQGLVKKSDLCSIALKKFSANVKTLFELVFDLIQGKDVDQSEIRASLGILMINFYQVSTKCDASELPLQFYSAFFTKEGLVRSYINLGMHLDEIESLEKSAAIDLLGRKFFEFGEEIGNILGLIIDS